MTISPPHAHPDLDDKRRKNRSYRDAADDYGVWEIPGLFENLPADRDAAFDVLEIGCGYGHSAAGLKRAFPNARVVAADMIEECLDRTRGRHPGIKTIWLDADAAFPLGDAEFDVVFSSNLFEHLHDDQHHLQEVRRVLRPGGCYVVSTPNLLAELIFYGLFRPERGSRWLSFRNRLLRSKDIPHCNLQTIGSLLRRFERAGFTARACTRPALSNTERRKLGGLLPFPEAARDRAVGIAEKVWGRLPPSIGPSLVVVGHKPS